MLPLPASAYFQVWGTAALAHLAAVFTAGEGQLCLSPRVTSFQHVKCCVLN
jgi:hypothetical protein